MAATSNVEFSSIQAFQHHFQKHDTLVVPQNHAFVVHNIQILKNLEGRYLPETQEAQVMYLLNQMTHTLGRTVSLRFFQSYGPLDLEVGDDLSIKHSKSFTLVTKRERIYTRLRPLFDLMVATSIQKVIFAPDQQVVILGVSETEHQKGNKVRDNLKSILLTRTPEGFIVKWDSRGGNMRLSRGLGRYASSTKEPALTLKAESGIEIALEKTHKLFIMKRLFRRLF